MVTVPANLHHLLHFTHAHAQACFIAADAGEFDVVHNHAGVEGMVLAARSATPVISTMHNPFTPRVQTIWDAYPWFHHAVSAASAATFPTRGALPPIHHGIDVAAISRTWVGATSTAAATAVATCCSSAASARRKGADRAI